MVFCEHNFVLLPVVIDFFLAGTMAKHAVLDLVSSFKLEFMMNSLNDSLLRPILSMLEIRSVKELIKVLKFLKFNTTLVPFFYFFFLTS